MTLKVEAQSNYFIYFAECCAPIIACVAAIWKAVCECLSKLFCAREEKSIQKPRRVLTDLPHNILLYTSGFCDEKDYARSQQTSKKLALPFETWLKQVGNINAHILARYAHCTQGSWDANSKDPLVLPCLSEDQLQVAAKSLRRLDLTGRSMRSIADISFEDLFPGLDEPCYPNLLDLRFNVMDDHQPELHVWQKILKHIVKDCPGLKHLSTPFGMLCDELEILLKGLPQLTDIEIQPQEKFEELAALLKTLSHIKNVKIKIPLEATTDVLEQIYLAVSKIPQLKSLEVCRIPTRAELINVLNQCQRLTELRLANTRIDREVLSCLGKMPDLTNLHINMPDPFDGRSLICLTEFAPHLRLVTLISSFDERENIEHAVRFLRNLTKLAEFTISVPSAEVLRNIALFPNLRKLTVAFADDCGQTNLDKHLLQLTRAPHLESLTFIVENIDPTLITHEGLLTLLLNLPKLKEFYYYNANLEPVGIDWQEVALMQRPDLIIFKGIEP